jgi:hypothetical protein
MAEDAQPRLLFTESYAFVAVQTHLPCWLLLSAAAADR